MITEAPITVRDVLRLLLAADSYPRLGNHDWREADLLEAEALKNARTAEPRADDPPEAERQKVYFSLHDFFDDGSHDGPIATSLS